MLGTCDLPNPCYISVLQEKKLNEPWSLSDLFKVTKLVSDRTGFDCGHLASELRTSFELS